MVLSLEARVFLVEQVFRNASEYTEEVQQKFKEKYPDTPVPHRNAVRRLITKFRETGSVVDAPRSGRPAVITEEKILDISNRILQSPKTSVRKLAQQTGISYSSTRKVLKKHLHLHPYKVTSVHEWKGAHNSPLIKSPVKTELEISEGNEIDIKHENVEPYISKTDLETNEYLKHSEKSVLGRFNDIKLESLE